jgi:hypothetical protein
MSQGEARDATLPGQSKRGSRDNARREADDREKRSARDDGG